MNEQDKRAVAQEESHSDSYMQNLQANSGRSLK